MKWLTLVSVGVFSVVTLSRHTHASGSLHVWNTGFSYAINTEFSSGLPRIPRDYKNEQHVFDKVLQKMDETLESRRKKGVCKFRPTKLNFTKEGRTISEEKCYDYIWEIKQYEEKHRIFHSSDCIKRKWKNVGVTGGAPAKLGEFPHMGAVGWLAKNNAEESRSEKWKFLCGSFLISGRFLVTAAHCQMAVHEDIADCRPKIVRLGATNIANDTNPIDARINSFIAHPDYVFGLRYNDIAIIELKERVYFNIYKEQIRPACLWNRDSIDSLTAIVTGWGVMETETNSQKTSEELQVASVYMTDSESCDKMLRVKHNNNWYGVADNQVCANSNNTADACFGDSGGPMQLKLSTSTNTTVYSAIGVTSFGFGCGSWRFPSIYTRISSFVPWIEDVVWKGKGRIATPVTCDTDNDSSDINVSDLSNDALSDNGLSDNYITESSFSDDATNDNYTSNIVDADPSDYSRNVSEMHEVEDVVFNSIPNGFWV